MAAGSDSADFPRRYFADDQGHRVIIGLTRDETSEFEALDSHHADTQQSVSVDGRRTIGMKRWLELYAKHATAWDAFLKKSRIGRDDNRIPSP